MGPDFLPSSAPARSAEAMMTIRQIKIHRALLQALSDVPEGYLLPEDILLSDTNRRLIPSATHMEFQAEISRADAAHRIAGILCDEGKKWKITETGSLWLSEHP